MFCATPRGNKITESHFQANRLDCFPCIKVSSRINLVDALPLGSGLGFLAKFVRRYYAPFLLKPIVKAGVLIIFTGAFVASVISMQHLQLGLGMRPDFSVDFMLICIF